VSVSKAWSTGGAEQVLCGLRPTSGPAVIGREHHFEAICAIAMKTADRREYLLQDEKYQIGGEYVAYSRF
jgi:hypothetical protein